MKSIEDKLKNYNELASADDAFCDPLADMDERQFAADLETMAEAAGKFGFGEMPESYGMAGSFDAFAAKEVGLFDKVIVHGFKGDYVLSFEEIEEGLVIKTAN